MDGSNSWCLIESDPGVFTELIREFGCSGAQVEELLALDYLDDSAYLSERLSPVHGLIFLYRWRPTDQTPSTGTVVLNSTDLGLFFAKQTITNACATQAILSVLLNCRHPDIELGDTLTGFRDFVQAFSPVDKGLTLGASVPIKEKHNAFARAHMFAVDPVEAKEGDDVFHFVAYIPFMGRIYELDGMREGPVDLGVDVTEGQNWLVPVKEVLMSRVASFPAQEIRFNLMAIVTDRKMVYEGKINDCEKQKDAAALKMEAVLMGEMVESTEAGALSSDPEELQQIIESAEEEIEKLLEYISQEDEKAMRYHIENIRRKHNYLPVILELLKILARKKMLLPLAEKAKEKAIERRRSSQANKPKGKVAVSSVGDVKKT